MEHILHKASYYAYSPAHFGNGRNIYMGRTTHVYDRSGIGISADTIVDITFSSPIVVINETAFVFRTNNIMTDTFRFISYDSNDSLIVFTSRYHYSTIYGDYDTIIRNQRTNSISYSAYESYRGRRQTYHMQALP